MSLVYQPKKITFESLHLLFFSKAELVFICKVNTEVKFFETNNKFTEYRTVMRVILFTIRRPQFT